LTAMVNALQGVGDAVLGDVCGATAQRLLSQTEACVVHQTLGGQHTELWARGLGGIGSLSGAGGQIPFNQDFAGEMMGAGIGWGGLTIGVGGGYVADGVNFADGSSATQNAGLGFVYGRYEEGALRLAGMAGYGGGPIDGMRALPGTGLAASGDRHGDLGIVEARAAYEIPLNGLVLEPRATLAYFHAGQNPFSESGAAVLDLSYGGTTANEMAGRLVARVKQDYPVGGWVLTPWLEAGVEDVFFGLSRAVNVTAGAATVTESGISPAPIAGVVGVGVTASVTNALDLFVSYQGLYSGNQTVSVFSGGLCYRF
jgi:outer membrane autotransporter protein